MEKITKLLTFFVGILFAMTTSGSVVEANATNYNLYIDGTRVTSDNASDVKGDGVFVYDASANILYINGSYTTTASPSSTNRIVDSSISGLTVMINNNAELTFHECAVFHFSESATITGSGKLTVNSTNECGFYLTNGAELTIDNAKDIDIYAQWGIAGPNTPRGEKLTINNSNVDITSSIAAISDLSGGFYLFNGFINSPSGAYFDTKDLKDADGDVATSVIIRNTTTTTIDGINYELTPATHKAEVIWGEYAGDITIPASVTYEGEPYAVTAIHEWAFYSSGITSVILPEGLTTIGNGVFNGCSSLTHVELPSTLTNVGQYQFLGCSALTTVSCYATTPPDVYDETAVFIDMPNSVMLFVPEGSVSAYKNAPGWKDFGNIYGVVTKVQQTIDGINYEIDLRNQTAEVVGNWTIGYSGDINIPSSVTYNGGTYPVTAVRGYSFLSSAITSVTVSEGLTTIGDGAFNGCLSLTTVSLPSTLTSVGNFMFSGCSQLETVYCYATTPPAVVSEYDVITLIESSNTATLYVPVGCLSAYQNAPGWSAFSNIVEMEVVLPEGTDLIVNGTFEDSDLSAFYYHRGESSVFNNPITSSFIQTESGNNIMVITSMDGATNTWDTQFFVGLSRPVVEGETLYFTMRAKANTNVHISSQANRNAPGDYIHWEFVGNYDLTTEWQTFTKEVTVTSNMAGAQYIAFTLNEEYATYYFDDMHLIAGGGDNPGPIVYGDNMIVNGDFEGTDMDAFSSVQMGGGGFLSTNYTLENVDDWGFGNMLYAWFNPVDVDSDTGEPKAWQNRLYVKLNGSLSKGDHFRFSMRAKTSNAGDQVTISGHGTNREPGVSSELENYWGLLGEYNVTSDWQTFEVEGVVPESTYNYGVNELMFYIPVTGSGMMILFDDFCLQKEGAEPDTDYSLIDNTVYLEPARGVAGGQTTLSVKMKNTEAIQGFTFTLALPEGVTVALDNDGLPMVEQSLERTTVRKTDFFGSNIDDDGNLRVLYSLKSGNTFDGNDGEVARITVNLASGMSKGDYPILMKNVSLSNNLNESHSVGQLKSTLSVIDFIPGDVNGDLEVDVADFTLMANYLLGKTLKVFIEEAADVAGGTGGVPDGAIDIADLTGIANIILHSGNTSTGAPRRAAAVATDIDATDNAIYVEPVTAEPGTQQVLSVRMKNNVEVSGMEFSLLLPEGMTIAGYEMSGERISASHGHFSGHLFADGSLKMLCGSTTENRSTGRLYTFSGNDGEVARITVNIPADYEEGMYEVSVVNAKTADSDGVKTVMADTTAGINVGYSQTTDINSLTNPSQTGEESDYFTLDGKKLDKKPTQKGVYIVNGKKVVVK